MTEEITVKVVIHGTEFTFRTDDPDYIKELAEFVDREIREVSSSSKVSSQAKTITLAAFGIADELFKLRKEKDAMSEKFSERIDAMLQMTEEVYRSEQ